jgi:GNAT superfamily N-acetyltransferase
MAVEIVRVAPEDESRLERVRELMSEHFVFMTGHWPHMDAEAFAEELRAIPETYPVVLLALLDDEAAGCIMLRDVEDDARACEVRRMFVRPALRRRGVARSLATRLMAEACGLGYSTMRLVTTNLFDGALPLYESLGFAHVEPFRPSTMPLELVSFMQRDISGECPAAE